MGALDQLRGEEGILERARSSPRLVIAIAGGAILILAWIGWAIYVTSSNGTTAGLGVVIAWPAMLAALVLISLPFIGGYLLVKRLSEDSGENPAGESDSEEETGSEGESEDSAEEEDEKPAEEEEQDEAGDDDEEDEDGDEDGDEDDEDSEEVEDEEEAEAEKAAD